MIDLRQFCAVDRVALDEPWSDGDRSYACDSRILIFTARQLGIFERPDAPKVVELLERSYPPLVWGNWSPCPTYDMPMPVVCAQCGGKGEHLCVDCDTWHECGRCKGRGTKALEVWPRVMVGRQSVAEFYLAKIRLLPAVAVALDYAKPGEPMPFRFEGGGGIITTIQPKEAK